MTVSLLATAATDHFNEQDERYAASIARWVASVAHRAELVEEIGRNSVEQGRRAMADELVTILAHDLRNFVNPISGRLQIYEGAPPRINAIPTCATARQR